MDKCMLHVLTMNIAVHHYHYIIIAEGGQLYSQIRRHDEGRGIQLTAIMLYNEYTAVL